MGVRKDSRRRSAESDDIDSGRVRANAGREVNWVKKLGF